MILASRLELSFLLTPASQSWTGHRPVPGGPSKMGDCQAGWPVYNGGNPLKGVTTLLKTALPNPLGPGNKSIWAFDSTANLHGLRVDQMHHHRKPQQAMTNDFDLNMENNMRMRDTQFFGMFCLKTLENQIKCF
jgi:hypothetical protein